MRGKCNCGKKATSEWLVEQKSVAHTLLFCDKCAPKINRPGLQKIYWNEKKVNPNLHNS